MTISKGTPKCVRNYPIFKFSILRCGSLKIGGNYKQNIILMIISSHATLLKLESLTGAFLHLNEHTKLTTFIHKASRLFVGSNNSFVHGCDFTGNLFISIELSYDWNRLIGRRRNFRRHCRTIN